MPSRFLPIYGAKRKRWQEKEGERKRREEGHRNEKISSKLILFT